MYLSSFELEAALSSLLHESKVLQGMGAEIEEIRDDPESLDEFLSDEFKYGILELKNAVALVEHEVDVLIRNTRKAQKNG